MIYGSQMISPGTYPEFEVGGGRFGMGIEVHTQPRLRDGSVLLYGSRYLWIGTDPGDEVQQAGRAARMQVRREYAEILEWLGEPVDVDICHPTGADLLRYLRQGNWTPMDALSVVNGKQRVLP
jgi:hypothetical protein